MPVGCAPQTYYDEGTEMYRPCHVICDGLEYSETTRWECADYCEEYYQCILAMAVPTTTATFDGADGIPRPGEVAPSVTHFSQYRSTSIFMCLLVVMVIITFILVLLCLPRRERRKSARKSDVLPRYNHRAPDRKKQVSLHQMPSTAPKAQTTVHYRRGSPSVQTTYIQHEVLSRAPSRSPGAVKYTALPAVQSRNPPTDQDGSQTAAYNTVQLKSSVTFAPKEKRKKHSK